jgi:hypothetical protein
MTLASTLLTFVGFASLKTSFPVKTPVNGFRKQERIGNSKRSNPFFLRPYIKFGGLKNIHVNPITMTYLAGSPEEFEGRIWFIPVITYSKNGKCFISPVPPQIVRFH